MGADRVDGHELRRAMCVIGVVGQVDGRDVVFRESVLDIVDQRIAGGLCAQSPVEKTLRDALRYVGLRDDGDVHTLAERAELWMRESRVLIDMQKKLAMRQPKAGAVPEWFEDVRRCLEDVATQQRAHGYGDGRMVQLLARMSAWKPIAPQAQPVEPTLWCLHILGPDDVHPAPSKAHAELAAGRLNEWWEKRQDKHEHDPELKAVVAPWPHCAESHAAGVGEFVGEWLTPAPPAEQQGQAVAPFGWVCRGPHGESFIPQSHGYIADYFRSLSQNDGAFAVTEVYTGPQPAAVDAVRVDDAMVERGAVVLNEALGGSCLCEAVRTDVRAVLEAALSAQAGSAAGATDPVDAWREAVMDGNAVRGALDDRAKARTSVENVADVLDATARVARALEGRRHG